MDFLVIPFLRCGPRPRASTSARAHTSASLSRARPPLACRHERGRTRARARARAPHALESVCVIARAGSCARARARARARALPHRAPCGVSWPRASRQLRACTFAAPGRSPNAFARCTPSPTLRFYLHSREGLPNARKAIICLLTV